MQREAVGPGRKSFAGAASVDAVMLSSAALRQACFPARKGKGREEAETG